MRSHVIPKFVTQWLKDTSATGYLRRPLEPNLRRQDTQSIRLLCADCEQLLSGSEREFAEGIFYRFQNSGRRWDRFEYSDWLIRFAVSLAWRVVAVAADLRQTPPSVPEAAEQWRRFLIGEAAAAGYPEHHIFFLDKVESGGPRGVNVYFLRAVDATLAIAEGRYRVYVKLPGIIFWACIDPPSANGWEGTRIEQAGVLSPPQKIMEASFGDFLVERARRSLNKLGRLSSRQKAILDEAIRRDPDRVIESGTAEAILADMQMATPFDPTGDGQ